MPLFSRKGHVTLSVLSALMLTVTAPTLVAFPAAHADITLANCAGGNLTLAFDPALDRTQTPQTTVTGATTQKLTCMTPALETAKINDVDAIGNLSCLASSAFSGTMEIDWPGSAPNSDVTLSTLGFNVSGTATLLTLSGAVTNGRFDGATIEIEAAITNVLDYDACVDSGTGLAQVNAVPELLVYST